MYLSVYSFRTDRVALTVTSEYVLYSRGARFESWSGHLLSPFYHSFLQFLQRIPGRYHDQATTTTKHFSIYHSLIIQLFYIYGLDTESVVKSPNPTPSPRVKGTVRRCCQVLLKQVSGKYLHVRRTGHFSHLLSRKISGFKRSLRLRIMALPSVLERPIGEV